MGSGIQTQDTVSSRGQKFALDVALLTWTRNDGLSRAISATLEELGCGVTVFQSQDDLPEGADLVLAYGPFGPISPLAKRLLAIPSRHRPLFALWLTEQLSNPAIPDWIHRPLGELRAKLERNVSGRPPPTDPNVSWSQRWLEGRAHRLRYYGDLHWLNRSGLLSVLATGSDWITRYLKGRGFSPITAYVGSHPAWWADLGLERDIPVLWLGKMGSTRRRRMLELVRQALGRRGIEILVVDGVEHPYVFEDDRTRLLNRAAVVLNLLRTPWDNHSLRYFLAASNRALIVSEPTLRHIPFEPGRHVVEAPIDQMADAICQYLEWESERLAMTEQAFELATKELSMSRSVAHILEQVSRIAHLQSEES